MAKRKPLLTTLRWTAFASDLGWIGIAYDDEVVQRVLIGHSSQKGTREALDPLFPEIRHDAKGADERIDRLRAYAAGEEVGFGDIDLGEEQVCTPFFAKVYQACRQIPYGQTSSYADLARVAGSSRAARAVGQAMAANRWPIIVPCHRVLRAGGKIGGFSAPTGIDLKQRMLDREQAP